jgi:hypothetical protein
MKGAAVSKNSGPAGTIKPGNGKSYGHFLYVAVDEANF